jgi:hypothetical protein
VLLLSGVLLSVLVHGSFGHGGIRGRGTRNGVVVGGTRQVYGQDGCCRGGHDDRDGDDWGSNSDGGNMIGRLVTFDKVGERFDLSQERAQSEVSREVDSFSSPCRGKAWGGKTTHD